jgi:dTMP kinase
VAAAFDSEGIPAVLFKSPWWFPSLSSNLDVLVPPSAFQRAAAILEKSGHIRLPHYHEDHKLLFRTFRGGRPSLSVHLHEAVSWGKALILEAEEVIRRSLTGADEGVRVASPRDSMIVTVAHTVMETDQVRLGDLLVLSRAVAGGGSPKVVLDAASEGGWIVAAAAGLRIYDAVSGSAGGPALLDGETRSEVDRILSLNAWSARRVERILERPLSDLPLVLPRSFSKVHLVRSLLADHRLADLVASGWNLVSTRLRVRSRPGSLITLSGPDGAGKSSLAAAVAGALDLCEVSTSRLWSRGGFSALAVAGKSVARRAAAGAIPATADEGAKRRFLRSRWRRTLWVWGVVLEQALTLQRIRILKVMGRTVVADRYIFDSLADLVARLPHDNGQTLPLRPASFLLGTAPRPDLAFLIELPAEVAHARKADNGSVEARRALADAYAVAAVGAAFARLDGTRPREELIQETVEAALRRCFRRFEERGR